MQDKVDIIVIDMSINIMYYCVQLNVKASEVGYVLRREATGVFYKCGAGQMDRPTLLCQHVRTLYC